MKRVLSLVLMLCLLLTLPAPAESAFDFAELRRTPNAFVYEEPGTVNTIVRLMNQPYRGEIDRGDLDVFIDYVIMPEYDAAFLRLMFSVVLYDPLQAHRVAVTVGGKTYTFTGEGTQSEYDGIYMEDYTACLTDDSLAFLKAVAQQKTDEPLPVVFLQYGEPVLEGRVILPGEDAATLYDRYIDLGGKRQNLHLYEDIWPCEIK